MTEGLDLSMHFHTLDEHVWFWSLAVMLPNEVNMKFPENIASLSVEPKSNIIFKIILEICKITVRIRLGKEIAEFPESFFRYIYANMPITWFRWKLSLLQVIKARINHALRIWAWKHRNIAQINTMSKLELASILFKWSMQIQWLDWIQPTLR